MEILTCDPLKHKMDNLGLINPSNKFSNSASQWFLLCNELNTSIFQKGLLCTINWIQALLPETKSFHLASIHKSSILLYFPCIIKSHFCPGYQISFDWFVKQAQNFFSITFIFFIRSQLLWFIKKKNYTFFVLCFFFQAFLQSVTYDLKSLELLLLFSYIVLKIGQLLMFRLHDTTLLPRWHTL